MLNRRLNLSFDSFFKLIFLHRSFGQLRVLDCIKRIFEPISEKKIGCDSRTKCFLKKGFVDKIYSNINFEELLKIFSRKNLLQFFTKKSYKTQFLTLSTSSAHFLEALFSKQCVETVIISKIQMLYHQFKKPFISIKIYLGIHLQNKCHPIIASIGWYLNAENHIQISIQ